MDTVPDLSIIVPTVGRPSLARTLRSLTSQPPGELTWEAVLVGDTHAGTWSEQLPFARRLAQTDSRFVYTEWDGGEHAWGHPQRNIGSGYARGRYLAWLGDDDLYVRGAFDAIHRALDGYEHDPRVFLFRWIAPWKQVLWHTAGYLGDEPGHIDAECIVCPNDWTKLGTWTSRYQGDWDMIRSTVNNFGGLERVIWQPEVIAQAQPADAEDWTQGGRAHPPALCRTAVLQVLVPQPVPVRQGVPA
jgi:hypothetical protein